MFSKAFLEYRRRMPAGLPTSIDGPGMPVMGPPTDKTMIPEEFACLKVPMMPPDFSSPEPEIPDGYAGGRIELGGVPGMMLTRPGVREQAAFLYIHGGGFTLGSGMSAAPLLCHFLEQTNLEGYSVDYSLAPYAQFPTQIDQVVAFYRGLVDKGIERIVVGGESAGATLTLSLVMALKAEGLPLPTAIWASSPIDDMQYDQKELFLEDMISDSCSDMLKAYAGGADPRDPRISPINGDFSNFPPSFIQAGSAESLAAGALRIVDKLVRAGNEVRFTFGKGMLHTFAMDYAIYPEAENAMNEILTFVNNVLDLDYCEINTRT